MPADPVTASGFEQFERDLERFQRAIEQAVEEMPATVGQKIEQALLLLQGQAAIYPAERPGQKYIRTGTLGRRWTTAQRYYSSGEGGFLVGTVGNNTWYGPLVMDEEEQMPVHQGRWKTIQQIARENQPRISTMLDQAGKEIAEELKERAEG